MQISKINKILKLIQTKQIILRLCLCLYLGIMSMFHLKCDNVKHHEEKNKNE